MRARPAVPPQQLSYMLRVISEGGPAQGGQGGGSLARFLMVGGASVLLVQVVALLSGTASQLLLARLLTPEALAAYLLTLSVVETASHFGELGLPRPATRFMARAVGAGRLDQARGVLLTALPLCAAAAAVTGAIYAGGLGSWLAARVFGSSLMASGTWLAAAWIFGLALQEFSGGALRGLHRVGLAALLGGGLARVLIAVAFAGLLFSAGPRDFLSVLSVPVVATWLGAAAALVVVFRAVSGARTTRPALAVLASAALPLMATGLVRMVAHRTDLWAVGVFFSDEQVALYGVAKRLIVLVSLPLLILNLTMPPVIADLYARGERARLQRALRGAATLAGLPALAVLLLLSVASEPVLGLAFGDFYRDAADILVILSVERLIFVWVGPAGLVLVMTGHERPFMNITLATSVLTVGAVVLGAQIAGFRGVAWGFLVISALHQVLSWYAARRLTGLRTDVDLWNLRAVVEELRRVLRRAAGDGKGA